MRSSMAPLSVRLGARSRKLSNVGQSLDDQKFIISTPSRFERHVKPLVPAAFAVASIHQPALGPHSGLWPVLLMCNP
jgi:hypothetical protein